MSGNVFLATFLTGLREGLEATLVVTILVGFLVKSDRRNRLKLVWGGVGLALALSVGVVLVLGYASEVLTGPKRELFEAITSVADIEQRLLRHRDDIGRLTVEVDLAGDISEVAMVRVGPVD